MDSNDEESPITEEVANIELAATNQHHGIQGMADVINKILGKSTTKNILSGKKRTAKEGNDDVANKKMKVDTSKEKEAGRVFPEVSNNAMKEAMLRRIGTRGVVVLFNTVSNHQKMLREKNKAAKTEREKEKVVKSLKRTSFMDMLKTGNNEVKEEVKNEERDDGWNVLKQNFMLGTSLKHWDKTDNTIQDDAPSNTSDNDG